jgi:hypothetical protein
LVYCQFHDIKQQQNYGYCFHYETKCPLLHLSIMGLPYNPYGHYQRPWGTNFYVSLTMHLSITLANDQLDAQILIHLLQSSTCTCFEQYLAYPQEVRLY